MNEKHWMRPLEGKPCESVHLLPWIATDLDAAGAAAPPRRLMANEVRLHGIDARHDHADYYQLAWDGSAEQLAERIAEPQGLCQARYLWLARGWADLVLSGFAGLIDAGRYVWRFATIDGAKVLFVGALDGRALTVTSLANWTGKGGDTWAGIADREPVAASLRRIGVSTFRPPSWHSEAERTALGSLCAILAAQAALGLGRPAATAAAAGRRMWRCWMGPRIQAGKVTGAKKRGVKVDALAEYVGPLCSRPDVPRHAERHVVYPLPHEQYGSGRVDEPVTLLDLRNAYWAALAQAALPICYTGTLRSPGASELADGLRTAGGLALVRLDTPTEPFPLRWHGRSARALGRYWTWLCGDELKVASRLGVIQECHTWHRWSAMAADDATVLNRSTLAELMSRPDHAALAKPWRAMYSAVVGGFARWDRVWEDVDHPHSQGRWATWLARDPKTGGIIQYRSIGGRTQRLARLGESPQAVPLLYGYVTAHLRLLLSELAKIIGHRRLLAVTADTLWVRGTPDLLADLQGVGGALCRAALRVDTTYDRVWMDGKGRAVVQRGNERWVHSQGVPLEPVADAEGRVVWCAQGEWTCGELERLKHGVPIIRKTYDAGKIVRNEDYPWRPASPWLGLQDGLFREELLLPVLHPQQGRSAGEE